MVKLAKVKLFGQTIGVLQWDERRNSAQFEYSKEFASGQIEPSPLLMPLRQGYVYSFPQLSLHTYKGLPGMFADSLPDTYGRAIFDRWLGLTGRTSSNPVETLCFMGERCMGALEYEPAIGQETDSEALFEVSALVDAAREALSGKKGFYANLEKDRKMAIADILRLGTSAGGQRAKALIAYNESTGDVRSGQIPAPDGFEYYLLKLDGVSGGTGLRETDNFGRLEYSFYLLAKECGVDMAGCSLLEENGRAHFMTKRFDRGNGRKLHMQTLCGIAHYDFGAIRTYSYEQAFGVMRRLHLTYAEASQMFRRVAFNVVMRNQDDHTKNISFLMSENGKWTLAPAYDVGYAYNPSGLWTSTHQMSVNGKFDDINRKDLLELASANNVKNASEIIDCVCENAAKWPGIALNCGVPKDIVREISKNSFEKFNNDTHVNHYPGL